MDRFSHDPHKTIRGLYTEDVGPLKQLYLTNGTYIKANLHDRSSEAFFRKTIKQNPLGQVSNFNHDAL